MMPDVIHRTTLRYEQSIDTNNCPIGCGPCNPGAKCVLNPDMSAVAGVEQKYWKLQGDTVNIKDINEKSAKETALAARWTDDLRRYPHKAATGGAGVESTNAGSGDPTSGRLIVIARGGAMVDFCVNRILTQTNTSTSGDLLIGTATSADRNPSYNPLIIKSVVRIVAPTAGDLDLDPSSFDKFMVLKDDLIWVYVGTGYQRIKHVTVDSDYRGYYYKAYTTPNSLIAGLELTTFSYESAYALKLKFFG